MDQEIKQMKSEDGGVPRWRKEDKECGSALGTKWNLSVVYQGGG